MTWESWSQVCHVAKWVKSELFLTVPVCDWYFYALCISKGFEGVLRFYFSRIS